MAAEVQNGRPVGTDFTIPSVAVLMLHLSAPVNNFTPAITMRRFLIISSLCSVTLLSGVLPPPCRPLRSNAGSIQAKKLSLSMFGPTLFLKKDTSTGCD